MSNVQHVNFDRIAQGEPPGGDNMEPRVARLESDVESIKTDIKDIKQDIREFRGDIMELRKEINSQTWKLIGALIAILSIYSSIILYAVNTRIDTIGSNLDNKIETINNKFDAKFDIINNKIEHLKDN